MSIVKTYHKVNATEDSMNFSVSRMEDIFTQRKGAPDEPHRHHYYTVMIVKKGKGEHKIDFNSYKLAHNQAFFVAPGQVHQVKEKSKTIGYVMTFSNQFLIENNIRISFIESLNLFQNYGQSPPLIFSDEQFEIIENFCFRIHTLFMSDQNMKILSIGAYLKLLLIECNNVCSINPIESDIDSSGDNLIRTFKREVELNYKKEHSSSFYANKLFITADHLNRTVKSKIGKTAKDYIQTRIITEAKRLLFFTDLTNKEISYELGFTEPSNFSAFFKRHTQLSPGNFKKSENFK